MLRVSLHTGETQAEDLPDAVEQQYLGGRGAATWMLATQLPEQVGPLSPGNLLIFSAGALAGMGIPATGGFVVSTRSPITRLIAHSWADGRWGGALRRAGYDLLVLEGQRPTWCWLRIDGAKLTIEPADELLDLDTVASARALQQKLGDDYSVVCLGPAGTAGVAYSSLVADGAFMAEPAGTGAVMAHKRVKAIAVRGAAPIAPADAGRVATVVGGIGRRVASSELARGIRQYGSLFYGEQANEWGALTGRNAQDGRLAHIAAFARGTFAQRGKREWYGCEGCPLPCHAHYVRRNGEPMAFPQLEALTGFGGG
jgi:aldehyde:ferredoxin oxidoreductase